MKYIFFTLINFLLMVGIQAKGQVPDSIRYRAQQAHYQRLLQIDKAKALSVAKIQVSHQDGVANVLTRMELNAQEKSREMNRLDSVRTEQLKLLLDPRQLTMLKRADPSMKQ